jgi:hypothetical protein
MRNNRAGRPSVACYYYYNITTWLADYHNITLVTNQQQWVVGGIKYLENKYLQVIMITKYLRPATWR